MKPLIYGFIGGAMVGSIVRVMIKGGTNVTEWSWFWLACAATLALVYIGDKR